MKERIIKSIEENIRTKELLKEEALEIEMAANLVLDALRSGKKVLLCGNGGSAADSQHIACELVAKLKKRRKALPAIALTVNTSVLTAISNDDDFEIVFERQVEALGEEGDVLIAISTSGRSKNVLRAVDKAKERGMKVIGLTGKKGDLLCEKSDVCIKVPSEDTQRIQESHILIGHIICEIVEEAFS